MKQVKLIFEEIENMAEWARLGEVGEMRIGYLLRGNHKSFNSSTARENGKFRKKGINIFIMHWVNAVQHRVAVRTMTVEEYMEIKRNISKYEQIQKELPKGFADPDEEWHVGAYYS